jgi:hypothetical protein
MVGILLANQGTVTILGFFEIGMLISFLSHCLAPIYPQVESPPFMSLRVIVPRD